MNTLLEEQEKISTEELIREIKGISSEILEEL